MIDEENTRSTENRELNSLVHEETTAYGLVEDDSAHSAGNPSIREERLLVDRKPIIKANELFRIYKSESVEVVALRGLNLTVLDGEIISIMGPSGCGKSTLLNIIGALDQPSAGRITVLERDLTTMEQDDRNTFRRKHIGSVFQFFNLVPTLTAAENIELPLRLVNAPIRIIRSRVDELLKLVGMEKRGHHRPDELSGGEQQRIAIAAALANDPEIILADEPTGELDSENGEMVLELLGKLCHEEGKTIIIVTHDPRTATISDRSFRIEDGQIKGEYTKEMYTKEGDASDSLQYKKMIENIVDKKRRMEDLLREIINIEDEMINNWK